MLAAMLGIPESVAAKVTSYGAGLFAKIDDEREARDLQVVEG